ncbi:MAG: heme-binding protein [Pseudomonadota bacterium]
MKRKFLIALCALLAVCLGIAAANVFGLEEPDYTVIESFDEWELRRYAPYLVAETVVDGDLKASGDGAFRILAGYIFGDNEPQTKMAMTVPVISEPGQSGYTYQFVMERAYDLGTLPVPNDARVELKEIPERLVAALRFSGRWREERIDDLTVGLLEALEQQGYVASADPLLARYNPPITPWFLRRNEILVEVRPAN